MVFHWGLSESKSPQVARTLSSILADVNNVVNGRFSTHPLMSKSSSLFINLSVTVPRAPITFGINVSLMFHSFFQFTSKFQLLIPLFNFFQFYSVVSRDSKVHNSGSSLFFLLLIIIRSGRLAEIWRSICMRKSRRVSAFGLWLNHVLWWAHFSFLHNSQRITFSTQSGLVLSSFCSNLLHSLIMWLMVSSLSPHDLHLLIYRVLSILSLT